MKHKKVLGLGVIVLLLITIAAVIFLPPLGKRRMVERERQRVEKIKGHLRHNIAYLNEDGEKQWDAYCNPIFAPLLAYQPTGQGFWTSWSAMGKMLMDVPKPTGYEERQCLYEALFTLVLVGWDYSAAETNINGPDHVWFYPDEKDGSVDILQKQLEKRRVEILDTLPSSGD